MRTETIEIYSFDELPEDAQQTALDNWRNSGIDYAWQYEWRQSLEAFCKVTGIDAYDWQVGSGGNYVNWRYNGLTDIEPDDLTGLRLRTWLINNWLPHFKKGKYYRLKSGKTRYSKIQFEYADYDLTGYCGDYPLLNPILQFIAKPDKHTSLADVIGDCLHDWARDWEADMDYQSSDEYIRETIEANGYEFYADGSMV